MRVLRHVLGVIIIDELTMKDRPINGESQECQEKGDERRLCFVPDLRHARNNTKNGRNAKVEKAAR
jgi:hypothetical protein